MIRNIVFDMGNVLLSYDPKPYVAREIPDPEAGRLLFDACFGGPVLLRLPFGLPALGFSLISGIGPPYWSKTPLKLRGVSTWFTCLWE